MSLSPAAVLALLAVLLTALSLNVSRLRMRHRVSFGDGGHKDLMVAVRAHGNALEQSLLFGLLLLAADYAMALPLGVAGAVGLVFLAVRVVHAAALFARVMGLRQVAHVATVGIQLGLAGAILLR